MTCRDLAAPRKSRSLLTGFAPELSESRWPEPHADCVLQELLVVLRARVTVVVLAVVEIRRQNLVDERPCRAFV